MVLASNDRTTLTLKSSRAESSQDQFFILRTQQVLKFCTDIWWFLIPSESTSVCVNFIFLEKKPWSWRKQVEGSRKPVFLFYVSIFIIFRRLFIYAVHVKVQIQKEKFRVWLLAFRSAEFSSYSVSSFEHLPAAQPALCSSTPIFPLSMVSLINPWVKQHCVEECTAQTRVCF